jgi:hypothetical protein
MMEGAGQLVLAERQKVDVDELLVDPDFQQNPSTASRDAELQEIIAQRIIAQRAAEFGDLFDGVPNPMHDSETELTEAEAKEQEEYAGLAELEAPRRSFCYAFFSAFLLLDLWQWFRSPFRFHLLQAPHLLQAGFSILWGKELTEAEAEAIEHEAEAPSMIFLALLGFPLLLYIFLFLGPIVLTVVAVSRGEHADLSTPSWLPALVPLVVHGILVCAYLWWAERLDQKGRDVSYTTVSEAEAKLFKSSVHEKMNETRRKHRKKLCLFALFVLGLFSIGGIASVGDGFVVTLKPEFPYRPQFLGARLLIEFLFRYSLTTFIYATQVAVLIMAQILSVRLKPAHNTQGLGL